MIKGAIFKDFGEYWHYARSLSEYQRIVVFSSLPVPEQDSINESYARGAWMDVFYRNEIDEILDELKDRYGFDVLDLRMKALMGKSVFIPTKFWDIVVEQMSKYELSDIQHVLSGIDAIPCKENPKVSLLVSEEGISELDK